MPILKRNPCWQYVLSIARHALDAHHLVPGTLRNVPPRVDDDRPFGEIRSDKIGVLCSNEEDARWILSP